MRIISGKYRSKQIIAPKNLPVRPTTDMAKEALFNILNNYFHFDRISVLDLFAGTGNISYELFSRGATQLTLVDQNKDCIRFIEKTFNAFGFEDATVIREDVFKYLKRAYQPFDLIFADPPYEDENIGQLVDIIFDRELVNEGGMFVLEHMQGHDFSEHPNFFEHRKYGNVHFSFFVPVQE